MKRTISFGKVDGYHTGKKNCEVTAEISYDERKGTFSAVIDLWNFKHSDILMGGQCFDEIAEEFPELMNNEAFKEVHYLWKNYHLNDFHAGTKAQESVLKEAVKNGELKAYGANNYQETCSYLESKGLLYDTEYMVEKTDKNGETHKVPYKYGSGWLKEDIPEEDVDRIVSLAKDGVVLERDDVEIDLD